MCSYVAAVQVLQRFVTILGVDECFLSMQIMPMFKALHVTIFLDISRLQFQHLFVRRWHITSTFSS
jgi:hypothetical protein